MGWLVTCREDVTGEESLYAYPSASAIDVAPSGALVLMSGDGAVLAAYAQWASARQVDDDELGDLFEVN